MTKLQREIVSQARKLAKLLNKTQPRDFIEILSEMFPLAVSPKSPEPKAPQKPSASQPSEAKKSARSGGG
jgi:hypothetical protein